MHNSFIDFYLFRSHNKCRSLYTRIYGLLEKQIKVTDINHNGTLLSGTFINGGT